MRRIRNLAFVGLVLGVMLSAKERTVAGDFYFPDCQVVSYGGSPMPYCAWDGVFLYDCDTDCSTLASQCYAMCSSCGGYSSNLWGCIDGHQAQCSCQ
jgi:hypothetical protein